MHTRCALPETPVCVMINRIKPDRGVLTVDIVINEPLARVELASRLSINQKLIYVSCLYSKEGFIGALPHPLPQQQYHLRYWTHRRTALHWGVGLRLGGRCIEVLRWWALKKIINIDTTFEKQGDD